MKETSLTRQIVVKMILSLLVLLVLVTPILYVITTHYYAEDLIRIVRDNGITNPHLDLQRDTMMGLFIQFFTIVIAVMIAMFLVLQRVPQKLWQPFRLTLERMGSFNVEKGTVPELPQTNVKEFSQLNTMLKGMMEKSVRSYRLEKEFTENASHELQTPLAVAMVEIDNLMQDTSLNERQLGALQNINVELRHMSRLSRNLLLLSKIENNQYQQETAVSVTDKIKSLQPMWQSLCVDKTMTFSLDTSTLIYCNETLLDSLLNNLVVNAIRHCKPQGEIVVTLKNNSLKVENASDGMPLDGEKIFSRFYRGDVSKGGASQKGNGLGLAIVKSICDYHHWTVSYAFEHGNHCFRVEF